MDSNEIVVFSSAQRERVLELMRFIAPAEFREFADTDRFKVTAAIEAVEGYIGQVATEGRCLVLIGDPGRGKTFAGYYGGCAAAIMLDGYWQSNFRAVTAADWLAMSIDDKEQFGDITKFRGLLLVDDMGVEHVSDWRDSVFDRAIDDRYRNRRPTIITTNLAKATFDELVGDRAASRFKGWGFYYGIAGEDLRKKPERKAYPMAEREAPITTGEL